MFYIHKFNLNDTVNCNANVLGKVSPKHCMEHNNNNNNNTNVPDELAEHSFSGIYMKIHLHQYQMPDQTPCELFFCSFTNLCKNKTKKLTENLILDINFL